MYEKIKILADMQGIPAGTEGVLWGASKVTGGLTLRFDRPGKGPEVITNVPPSSVEVLS